MFLRQIPCKTAVSTATVDYKNLKEVTRYTRVGGLKLLNSTQENKHVFCTHRANHGKQIDQKDFQQQLLPRATQLRHEWGGGHVLGSRTPGYQPGCGQSVVARWIQIALIRGKWPRWSSDLYLGSTRGHLGRTVQAVY